MESDVSTLMLADERRALSRDIRGESERTKGACSSFTGEGTWEVLPRDYALYPEIFCSWNAGPQQSIHWITTQWDISARLVGKRGRRKPLYPDPWKAAVPVP